MSENRKSAALILADGTVYRGVSFALPALSLVRSYSPPVYPASRKP